MPPPLLAGCSGDACRCNSQVQFVRKATRKLSCFPAEQDPQVVAIKATLYRTSSDSPIIAALLKAADNGKQVAGALSRSCRFQGALSVLCTTKGMPHMPSVLSLRSATAQGQASCPVVAAMERKLICSSLAAYAIAADGVRCMCSTRCCVPAVLEVHPSVCIDFSFMWRAVLVELKARFDEARNVGFATRLEEAGCNVAYGIVGLKTHAKCMLVVRREKSTTHGLRTYVHIGTGNYNPSTASTYTDMGVLSCDPQLGEDVVDMFKFLTGIHLQKAVGGFRKLLVGNQYMKGQLLELIDREIAVARRGGPAALCIKVRNGPQYAVAQ